MAQKTLNVKMQVRRDTADNWESKNPILAAGEVGYDTTNKFTKIGDGSTAWNYLPYFVTKVPLKVGTFADTDWEAIAQVAEEGTASEYFNVGDEKTIQLTTGEDIVVTILGFNHDDKTSGGKAGISIGMKDCLATTYKMNSSNTNVGGWDTSLMRTETMATLLSQLPADLQKVIKAVNKKASAGNKSTTITTSSDKLWLFCEEEISGVKTYGTGNEGEQYEYWKTVKDGTAAANRIKNRNGSAYDWWLRSPYASYATYFCCVYDNGNFGNSYAGIALGVSFGFCV